MTHSEIVLKIIGKVQPIGETNEDNERYKNLCDLCFLCDSIIETIKEVSDEKGRYEASIAKAGKKANDYLRNLQIYLNEINP